MCKTAKGKMSIFQNLHKSQPIQVLFVTERLTSANNFWEQRYEFHLVNSHLRSLKIKVLSVFPIS